MRGAAHGIGGDWVSRLADEVVAEAERRAPGGTIPCTSELTPSGPMDLGDLRGVMTAHLVADEIQRRGRDCVHVLFWNDLAPLRALPPGTPRAWREHLGKPLASVPPPPWSAYLNWAYHWEAPMIDALAALGVAPYSISQEFVRTSAAYREELPFAVDGPGHGRIDPVLTRYRAQAGPVLATGLRGGTPTPGQALELVEAPVLRWLYARQPPDRPLAVSFGRELQRTYDEWDALARKAADGTAEPAEAAAHRRAVAAVAWPFPTASPPRPVEPRPLPVTPRPLPYRLLAAVAGLTAGRDEETLRLLRGLDPEDPVASLDEVRPRLDRAARWIGARVPAGHRVRLRDRPDAGLLASLGPAERASIRLLLDGLDGHWSLDGLTALVYGVPRIRAGLPAGAGPTPELKAAQRAFCALLYRLLTGRGSGPRLPPLLLAAGAGRVRELLGA
ncbi:lysine--tRNA ligase [Planomonospora venezuelensis]|uniref:Lysine--tRNA ligase n=1 Tax=Planomonospora venezuelensis TaxID=1999 RepID=A0A841CY10_PLAVE|nr:lysyl-tRNA synthetase class I [Planomonospora venezuelensis]GIN00954.1 hypothetical protein Pve01_26120 [Planomonospora venezuelensis]